MKKILYLFIPFLFACNVQKQQIAKLDELAVKQPTEMARLANWLYPCFTGKAKSDTIITYKTGTATIDTVSSVLTKHDTIYKISTITKTVPKTTIKAIHDTVPDTRTQILLKAQYTDAHDSATVLRTNLSNTKDQLSASQHTADVRLWILIGIGAVILGIGIYKIYKFFAGGEVADAAGNIIGTIKKDI